MKKIILISIFYLNLLTVYAQDSNILRKEIGVGAFGSSLRISDKKFYILSFRGEYRTKFIKNKLGIGLTYNLAENKNDGNSEFAFGTIINYHFAREGKLDPYVGISPVYSKRTNSGSTTGENFHLKYQYGLKYFVFENFGFSLEISNYKFDGGLIASDKTKRKSGIFPTIGVNARF
jgi:hypothetical protein